MIVFRVLCNFNELHFVKLKLELKYNNCGIKQNEHTLLRFKENQVARYL